MIIHVTKEEVSAYKDSNLFNKSVPIHGISKMHVMKSDGTSLYLWSNFSYHKAGSNANIQLPFPPKQASSDQAPGQEVASMPSTKRDSSQKKPLCYHDVVKIVKGNFLGYYAIITKLGDLSKLNEDDEVKINYLKSFGKWAVASNDLDSRMICELTYIDSTIDRRSRYTIKEYNIVILLIILHDFYFHLSILLCSFLFQEKLLHQCSS